jgi:hypothetical protein
MAESLETVMIKQGLNMLSSEFWHGFGIGLGLFLGSLLVVYLMSHAVVKPNLRLPQ